VGGLWLDGVQARAMSGCCRRKVDSESKIVVSLTLEVDAPETCNGNAPKRLFPHGLQAAGSSFFVHSSSSFTVPATCRLSNQAFVAWACLEQCMLATLSTATVTTL
jgi:hypothetical protein